MLCMYQITNSLATAELGVSDYEETYQKYYDDGWLLIDVRNLKDDGTNKLEDYKKHVEEAVELLQLRQRVVVGCVAGESRSNSIAVGILVRHYEMDFYDAMELVREKVPIAQMDPSHILKLKKLFRVTLP